MKSVTLLSCLAALVVLFAANARYVYSDALHQVPRLTAGHVADPRFAGATFQLEGQVRRVGRSRQGITFFRVYQAEQDLNIDVPVFPSLGSPAVTPARGDTVRVTGNLGMYRGQPQIKPLSAAHVQVLRASDATHAAAPIQQWDPQDPVVPIGAATARMGETLPVGPLTATGVDKFTSRAGREHVRLVLADPDNTVQGIMYAGDWTDNVVELLKSGAPVVLMAEISEYRSRPSLVAREVFTLD